MNNFIKSIVLLSGWLVLSATVNAETYTVKGVGIQFKPELVFANEGDVIAFRDMPTHFVDSIKIPVGAEKMISKMGANYDYTITEPGIHLYKCPPHWGGRMGGLILVGIDLRNEEHLIDSLNEYRETVTDKIAKGYLKKVIKKIKAGKFKLPE